MLIIYANSKTHLIVRYRLHCKIQFNRQMTSIDASSYQNGNNGSHERGTTNQISDNNLVLHCLHWALTGQKLEINATSYQHNILAPSSKMTYEMSQKCGKPCREWLLIPSRSSYSKCWRMQLGPLQWQPHAKLPIWLPRNSTAVRCALDVCGFVEAHH